MKITVNFATSCGCGEKYNFLGQIEYKPGKGFHKDIKEEMEELGWHFSKDNDEIKCPECAGNTPVYCHECSVAGGADKPIYHAKPVCEAGIKNLVPNANQTIDHWKR